MTNNFGLLYLLISRNLILWCPPKLTFCNDCLTIFSGRTVRTVSDPTLVWQNTSELPGKLGVLWHMIPLIWPWHAAWTPVILSCYRSNVQINIGLVLLVLSLLVIIQYQLSNQVKIMVVCSVPEVDLPFESRETVLNFHNVKCWWGREFSEILRNASGDFWLLVLIVLLFYGNGSRPEHSTWPLTTSK